ncbi:FAD-dependent monooxygenase [Streptomyces sp. NBC_00536]|uniref:FAD-dependent monooxygenase n=1 Tax=Streptomyces sp. NBC_00536 TaxID=2975769 RepID=UPI003FCCADBB
MTKPESAGYDYDVVISGASLAGSAAAILLARRGVRVALLERRSDPAAYKVLCTHSTRHLGTYGAAALAVTAMVSVQSGAGVSTWMFPTAGPLGTASLRLACAAVIMLDRRHLAAPRGPWRPRAHPALERLARPGRPGIRRRLRSGARRLCRLHPARG